MGGIVVRYSDGWQKWAGSALSGILKSLGVTTSYRGPRTAGWHEERVRLRTAGGKRGPDQACGDHGCAGSLEGFDYASQRGRGRVKAFHPDVDAGQPTNTGQRGQVFPRKTAQRED